MELAGDEVDVEEPILASLQLVPEALQRRGGSPELESRLAHTAAGRHVETEIADQLGREDGRRHGREATLVDVERNRERPGNPVRDLGRAGRILGREVEVPATAPVYFGEVAGRTACASISSHSCSRNLYLRSEPPAVSNPSRGMSSSGRGLGSSTTTVVDAATVSRSTFTRASTKSSDPSSRYRTRRLARGAP